MSNQIKIYDFSIPEDFSNFFGYVSYLKEKGATVELKEVKKTRSWRQNRALHLFFSFCADALNDAGFEFCYRGKVQNKKLGERRSKTIRYLYSG